MTMHKRKLDGVRKDVFKNLDRSWRQRDLKVDTQWFAEWAEDLLDIIEKIERRVDRLETIAKAAGKVI